MSAIVEELQNGALFLPAREEKAKELLIALHGSGGSYRDFEGIDRFLALEKMNYLLLNGPIVDYGNYSWYSGISLPYSAYELLEKVLSLAEREGYPPEKTFLLGFSQGGAMTIQFGVRYKRLLAGYIAISCRVEELSSIENEGNREVIRKGEWLFTHGSRDDKLSPSIIKKQVSTLQQIGMQIDFREYDKCHEIDPDSELQEIREWIERRIQS